MRVLLDTHIFLWWVTHAPQLPAIVQTLIANRNHQIFFSAASGWEIAIKARLGKLQLPDQPAQFITHQLAINGFDVLPIQLNHTLQTYHLPNYHKDPFDRILIAQSQVENLPIVTADANIARYEVTVIWSLPPSA